MFQPPQNINYEQDNLDINSLLTSLLLTSSLVFVLVQRILNYYPNYPAHRLYFGEVETAYRVK